MEILVSYSRSTNVNEDMYFQNCNFEGNFCTYVFGKSFWHYWELKMDCWSLRHILSKKNIKYLCMFGGYNCCRKVNSKWSSHFPDAITTNMDIGIDFFVFKHPVSFKKIFSNSHFWLNLCVIYWILCAHLVMTSVILNTRRPNCQ